jgi:hypothetical protein
MKKLGVDTNSFTLVLRPYSKYLFGRYILKKKAIYLYVYRDKDLKNMFSFKELLLTALHEYVHHYQWTHYVVRVKGIMHDQEFYDIYNGLKDRVIAKYKLREVFESETRGRVPKSQENTESFYRAY